MAEQDRAAGGRDNRIVQLPGGRRATASVELKTLGGRRIYGYLRYSVENKTRVVYIGEAPGRNREERLRVAWGKAQDARLLHPREPNLQAPRGST